MFFELHSERIIGYKQLTNADLGRSKKSNQTHIGLLGDVLRYLPNNIEVDDGMLIYNNSVELLPLNFDRIENPDGSFRSPKIRKGERNEVSVVTFIRDRAQEAAADVKWYLFWFGLKSGQPVFFLFNENSDTYKEMTLLGIELREGIKKRITDQSPQFTILLEYIEKIVNATGVEIAEVLEIIAQSTDEIPKKYRKYDIDKAREIFVQIGKEGESLVAHYFAKLKETGEIANYKWLNEEEESGQPYDFYFETKTGELIYLDVKTTSYKFSQKMIFSSQELKFAASTNCQYHIYRVYVNENGDKCLRICTNSKDLLMCIHYPTIDYQQALANVTKVETIKFAILPMQEELQFGEQIVLR